MGQGTHVNAIGGAPGSVRELDEETVAAAAVFVESRDAILSDDNEIRAAIRAGRMSETHIRAELGAVLEGRAPGRQASTEITLFRSLGSAVADLAAAEHALHRAETLEIGATAEL